MKFKKADRVKCIDNTNYEDELTVGKEYLVLKDEAPAISIGSDNKESWILFKSDEGEIESAYVTRFEKVRENEN